MALVSYDSYADETDANALLRGTATLVEPPPDLPDPDLAKAELRGTELPGVQVRAGIDYDGDDRLVPDVGLASDMRSTLRYLGNNIAPVVLFRGSGDVTSERDMIYHLPERTVLRHSMMHSANVYDGMRGSAAGVGDTIASALRGSYSARARLERANVDRARMHGAIANFLPKINGTADANYAPDEDAASLSRGIGVVSAGVEISMPLFTSGVNLNTYRRAAHLSRASDYSYLAEEYRVALEAVAAHINLRLNRKIEQTLARNVKAMQRIAHIARKLYQAGDASRTDIAIAQANVEGARAELDLARKSREETSSDYVSITGKRVPSALAAPDYERMVPPSLESAIDMALNYNPTLASSLHSAIASKHAAKIERGRYGPQVNLYGGYTRELYKANNEANEDNWNIGVRLKVPLFDLSLAPNVNAARHEALEAGYRALDQSRLIEKQVKRQWTAYHSAARRTGIVERQVKAVAVSVEGSRREYQAGFRAITDVLNDQVKLARARITLETARHERMLAAYELAFTSAHPGVRELALAR